MFAKTGTAAGSDIQRKYVVLTKPLCRAEDFNRQGSMDQV